MKSAVTTTIEIMRERVDELRQQRQAIQEQRSELNAREDNLSNELSQYIETLEVLQDVQASFDK